MNIGIIGAGFTGLATALSLVRRGHNVVVLEKESYPGGLAVGFQEKGWEWSLEKHYHHWFTNDTSALGLAGKLNWEVVIKRPKTSIFFQDSLYQFDSVSSILWFPKLSPVEKIRMGFVLGLLKFNPFWKPLEAYSTSQVLAKAMGQSCFDTIWNPQLVLKFGDYAAQISLAWFWARIKKRTQHLAYPKGGFLMFAQELTNQIRKEGGKVLFDTTVLNISSENAVSVEMQSKKIHTQRSFEKLLVTVPSALFLQIAPQLPSEYQKKLKDLRGLGSINLILRLKKQFMRDKTYWLSICDLNSPATAIVEHTNFMDKAHYNNEHIVYVGKYLDPCHPFFLKSADELLDLYDPFLKKINKDYRKNIINYHVFKSPFAQPVIPKYYSRILPPFKTPLRHVFLSNIQQIYPWDRGTNYAIQEGEKAAELICAS